MVLNGFKEIGLISNFKIAPPMAIPTCQYVSLAARDGQRLPGRRLSKSTPARTQTVLQPT